MPSTRSCDGEAAGCASAAACMRASIVGAAMEDLEKGARETIRESQATHARRQDRPEGWIRRRPNDADWVRMCCCSIQRVRQSAFRLFHAVWRMVPPHGRSDGLSCVGRWQPLHGNASRSAGGITVLRRAYAEDAYSWRPLECASHSEHPTSSTRNKGCEGMWVKLLPKCRGTSWLFHTTAAKRCHPRTQSAQRRRRDDDAACAPLWPRPPRVR